MRLLSFIFYYISFLLGAYSVIFILIKIFTIGTDFYEKINSELIALSAGIILLSISKWIKPQIQKNNDGRTVTKKL
mgnify:CR=1 FL=1